MERVFSKESQRIIEDLEEVLKLTSDQIIERYGNNSRGARREILESPVLQEIRNEIMKIHNLSPLKFSVTESELKAFKKFKQED